MMKQKESYGNRSKDNEIAMHVSVVSIVINVILSAYKLIAGIAGHSGAMISDAVHSASDVFSTFIVMIGITIAGKKSDKEHPYGHERLECVASIILAVLLLLTGIGIGIGGIEKILEMVKGGRPPAVPGRMPLIAAIISIMVKEWMYWYTRAAAKKINSGALMADAWHHRSDALSSVGALIGILGARMGFPVLDPAAAVCICICIGKVSIDIFRDAMDKMIDKSCDEVKIQEIKKIITETPGVGAVDLIRTRIFGARIYVDIEIAVEGQMTLTEAHKIAEEVHDNIEQNFQEVKHCMVHVNPL